MKIRVLVFNAVEVSKMLMLFHCEGGGTILIYLAGSLIGDEIYLIIVPLSQQDGKIIIINMVLMKSRPVIRSRVE